MSKKDTAPKPRSIEILVAKRTRKTIYIKWRQGDGVFDLNERDNPLPSFVKAFDALAPLVPTILHLPEQWTENLRIAGVRMGEQGGTPTVQVVFRKSVSDASKEFAAPTPYRLLGHPTEPGSYTPPLVEKDQALVWEAIEEAKKYVRGDRAQGLITFEEEDGDDDEDKDDSGQTELPEVPREEKKKGRKRSTAAKAAAK